MKYYYGVIYFKDGSKRELGRSTSESSAERQACQAFEQAMKTAISDWFKPTRYEVKSEEL